MSNANTAAAVPGEAVVHYIDRIEAHLVRLAEGHDPMGHLFGIERLARIARAEWWSALAKAGHGRPKP